MDIKGWLIVGPKSNISLGSQAPLKFVGAPQDATNYPQGTVAECVMYAGLGPLDIVTLVCVRIPIMLGAD